MTTAARAGGSVPPGAAAEHRDGGSATVWLLAMMFALLSLAGVAFTVTVIGGVRQRAAGAADLAALSAAGTPPADEGSVCAVAARVSAANGGRLVSCHIVADAVEVAVRVRLPAVIGVRAEVIGHARAGPWGRAGGAYQPEPVQAVGQDRTSADRAAVRSSASSSPRRRRSATLATIRSPRRGWETGCGEGAETAGLESDRAGVGTRTADRPSEASPERVS
ncbi:Rv3654c family TadE-like protein [Frankia sp. AgB32]|uniref:Rv3654c family TadE-like protein n=1 Tax=Frankia sp. AgB32 TaxID=631119 RepID=UPI00200DE18E|nr:Rv3654c family TadE-like protein [Frankia sp. AgB32]MCK9895155.1 flp pilus-assembly TadE/G-like family protein [Frankia sp. AgB32]